MKKFLFISFLSILIVNFSQNGFSHSPANNIHQAKYLNVKCKWCGNTIRVKKTKDTYWSSGKDIYYKYEYINGFACGGGFEDYSKLIREFGFLFDIEKFIRENSYCTRKCFAQVN